MYAPNLVGHALRFIPGYPPDLLLHVFFNVLSPYFEINIKLLGNYCNSFRYLLVYNFTFYLKYNIL